MTFDEAVAGLARGDFSRLEPLFDGSPNGAAGPPQIIVWQQQGRFAAEPAALNEALSCACFNGKTAVADHLLSHGVDPAAGTGTGMDALHWAINRGQVETVKLLLKRKAPLETMSMHGTTPLGTAVWSAMNEPRADHLKIIQVLLDAGANRNAVTLPTGDPRIDALFKRQP